MPARLGGALGLLLAVGLLLLPSSALAASRPLLEAFGSANEPSFSEAQGLAVDQSTEDLLVIDGEANTISRWNPDGTPADFSALGTNLIDGQGSGDETPQGGLAFGSASEVQVAVDNSGGETDGNIYIPQAGAKVVDIFAEDGSFLGQLTESSEGTFAEPCGIAVDPSGDVYLGDFSGKIHKYEPAADPPVNGDSSANFAFSSNCTLAAGQGSTAGFIFAAHFNGAVAKLDSSTGEEKYEVASGSTTTVSVDPSSGHLFAAQGEEMLEFDASGASSATEVSSTRLAGPASGVAADGASGNAYATHAGGANVEVFGAPLPTFPLAIKKGGAGEGTVKSTPAGISCGSACAEETAEFIEGEVVELEAAPESNSEFAGWSAIAGDPGTCTGTTSPCEVTMDEAVELEAGFAPIPSPEVTALSPTEGPTGGGNQIEITGLNLTNATKVEFGSAVVNAPFTENTATTIKLNAPGHSAGTFNVTVTTPGGSSADTAADDYTYVAKPAVTGLGPANGPTSGGNEVAITGLRLGEATKVEFGATVVNAPFDENTATTIKVNAPAHTAGTVSVRVTTPLGTSVNFPADDYTYEVPTPAPPGGPGAGAAPVTFSASPSPLLQCIVPKLKGLSLSKAREALAKANCKAGKVTRPKAKNGKKLSPLVLKSSKPSAGASLPADSKVDLRLGPKPKKKGKK